MWLVLALIGCGLDPSRIPPHPAAAPSLRGGEGPARVAILGAMDDSERTERVLADLAASCAAAPLDVLVVLDPPGPRATTRAWRALADRLDRVCAVPVLSVVGPGTLRGDPRRRGLLAAFPGTPADGYRMVDVPTGATSWRLVALEVGTDVSGTAWADQQYWLPRALDAPRVVVFVASAARSLTRLADPPDAAATLVAAVRDHVAAGALAAIVQGGVASNELHLPGGAWGEAWIVAGTSGVPSADLLQWRPGDPTVQLATPFARALRSWGAGTEVAGVPVFPGAAVPTDGWWELTLEGDAVSVTFHRGGGDVVRLRHTADAGWASAPEP